jgi:hypothetical protein
MARKARTRCAGLTPLNSGDLNTGGGMEAMGGCLRLERLVCVDAVATGGAGVLESETDVNLADLVRSRRG